MKLRKSNKIDKENVESTSTDPIHPHKARGSMALRNRLQFENENPEKLAKNLSIHKKQVVDSQNNVQFANKNSEIHSDNLQIRMNSEPASPEKETQLEQISEHNIHGRTKQKIAKELSKEEIPQTVNNEDARERRRGNRNPRKDADDNDEDIDSDESTTKESGFKCKICHRSFIFERNMERHMQWHEPASCRCDICGQVFKQARYLANHAPKHLPAQDSSSRRCVCGKLFQTASSYRSHKKRFCPVLSSNKVKYIYCQICRKKILPDEYKQHQDVCTGERQRLTPKVMIKCKICSKVYVEKYMKQHLMKQHDIIRSAPSKSQSREGNGFGRCPICNKVFKTKSNLSRHKRFCERTISAKPYVCDVCNKHFAEKEVLARHIRRAHANNYICDYCGKQFGAKYYLSRHITNMHMKENFKHEFCPRTCEGISNDKLTDLIRGAFKEFSVTK